MALAWDVSIPPREAALDGPGGYARGFFLDTAEVAKELLCPLCTHVLRKATAIQGDPGGLVYCESCLLHRFFAGPAPVPVPSRAAAAAALPPPDQAAGHASKAALTSPTRSPWSSAAGATMRGSGTGGGGTAKPNAPPAAAAASATPAPPVAVHTARTPADLKPILLFQRKVQRLRVACHIAPHRCWTVGLMGADESFWRSHDAVCAYAADACAACGAAMERGLLAAHAQFECSMRFVTCAACGVGGGTLRACDMDAHRKVCARQAQIEALGTQLLATAAFHHMLDGDTRTVASVVTQSAAVRLVDAERTLTALRALAVEYRAEIEEYGRRLHAAIVARQRTVDAWRDAGRREEEVIEETRISLADTDSALSRHLADISTYHAEFERVWHRVMAAIDFETERVQLRIDAVDAAHQSDLHALTSALEEAGRQFADARLAWTDEVEAPQQKAAELAAESALHEYEQRAAAAEADEMRRGSEAVLASGALIATERVRHDAELRKRAFKQAVLQAANFADSKRTTAATLALDDRRLQDLQRLHAEVADSHRLLADSEAERRDEALRTRESVHQSELRRRALFDRLRETLRVSDAERQANVERQINTIRAATESMQEGLREVRSELYAAQQLHDDTEQRCAIEGQQAEVALRQEEQMRAVDVQNVTGETRRITEALLISAAQREADVAEWTARFTDQAARQQQTADAFAERLRVHGAADGETHKATMLGGVSAYEQVSRADAEALKTETVRLSSLVNASVVQRDADADLLSEQREHLDDTTDADAARLADSLAELAAGRKADDANVKERTVALKAEFAAIVAELARVEKKHASKFAKLTAAADTMRAETEEAAAAQQRRADTLAEAMLRQTNNQQTSYETMRFEVQRTVEQLHQSDFERRADAERLLEQLRQAGVQQQHDVDAAAEQLRRIERERAVNEQRRTEWVRRQDTEFKTDVLAARSEMQRLEEAFRRVDMERKAVDSAPASASAVDAAGKRRDAALRGNGDGMAERITADMKATHERLRESKRDREVLSNFLYKDREARIEQVFECDDQTAALRKSMRALRERLLPIVDRMPTAVSRASNVPAAHAKTASGRDNDRDGSQLQQLQASLDLPPRPQPQQPEVAPRRPNGAANPVLVAPAGVATAVAAAMAATAVAAAASDAAFVHPGQWRVYRRMEYWTCCQTPSSGNKDARGCQAAPENQFGPR